MTGKKVKAGATPKAAQTEPHKPNDLKVTLQPGQTKEHQLAEIGLSACAVNAHTAALFAQGAFGKIGIGEAVAVMRAKAVKVETGDLSELEATLTAQAATLDAVFNEMARRAFMNLGQHLDATEKYMRLALKAQGQCRATAETLAEIKFPRSATFIKQANIAGQQQVNNGGPAAKNHSETMIEAKNHAETVTNKATSTRICAPEKTINPTNELISEQANATLDTTGTRASSRLDSKLEAVAASNRTKNRGRQTNRIQ